MNGAFLYRVFSIVGVVMVLASLLPIVMPNVPALILRYDMILGLGGIIAILIGQQFAYRMKQRGQK